MMGGEDRWREARQAAHEQRQLKRLAQPEHGALSGLRGLIHRAGLLISARRAAFGERLGRVGAVVPARKA